MKYAHSTSTGRAGTGLLSADRGDLPRHARYKLAGKLIKGQPVGGVRDQWVVTEHVYTAVQAAERLAALRGGTLFPNVVFHLRLRTFREWVNGPAGQRLGLAPIPDAPVNLRMLRRTLAVALAYRPGGLLTAKVQLKHVSVAVTEGYASRPGGAQARFLADVAAEEQNRNLELLRRKYELHHHGVDAAGPGARRLSDFFRALDSVRRPDGQTQPNVIDNDQQIRAMLARRAKTLHLGAANHCWFSDPAQALCLKAAGTPNSDRPLPGMCDSTRCAQSTFHQVHREVWQNAVDEHKRFLAELPRSQRIERARLTRELDRAKQTLAAIDAARSSDGA